MLYEDDGLTYGYEQGVYALTAMTLRDDGDDLLLQLSERQARFPPLRSPA